MKVINLDWSSVKSSVKLLVEKLSLERPEVIIAIGSGGLVLAGIISRIISVRDIRVISVKKYSDEKPPKQVKPSPLMEYDNSGDIRGRCTLLIDDFSSTGETLEMVRRYLYEKGASKVVTCSLVVKHGSKKPDYYAMLVGDCVIFPWE